MTILAHLYPTVRPRPSLSSDAIGGILPLVHKYDIACLLEDCLAYLKIALPDRLSPKISSPDYVIKWLKLADDLQLDDLRDMCMKKAREMARNSQLGFAIMHTPGKLNGLPSKPKPSGCFSGHCSRHSSKATCPMWCKKCNEWVCTMGSGSKCYYKKCVGGCVNGCGGPIRSPPTFSGPLKVNDTVKGLSRDTLEELLASVVAACNCEYMA